MNCIAISLNASVGPWYNSRILFSPSLEILTTLFSLKLEYDFSTIFDNSFLLIDSSQNKKIISFAKSL